MATKTKSTRGTSTRKPRAASTRKPATNGRRKRKPAEPSPQMQDRTQRLERRNELRKIYGLGDL